MTGMTVSEEAPAMGAEFPAATREQWQQLVADVLAKSGRQGVGGPEAERALATEVEDGLWVQPLYTAQDTAPEAGWPGFAPFVRGGRVAGSSLAGWDVRQQHTRPDPQQTNKAVLADLDGGVTSLWLTLGPSGLPVSALPDVLRGVYLDLAGIVVDAGPDFGAAADILLGLYAGGPAAVPAAEASGNLGADPLGLLARTGDDGDVPAQLAQAAGLASRCADEFPGLRALTVDALPYHDAGASAAQELGLSIATAVAYLRVLTQSGLTADQAAGQLEFRYAAGADQFLTVAKLRAARRLWSRVAQVCGIGATADGRAAAQRQHAVTSSVMMTERDPWVNMLRTTVACLAAGVGGADAITVLPFDSALGLPDDFARRIARNTQALLLDESNLARVIDPAGGSWYVERLTDQLARAAWDWFQRVERAGGQQAALRDGLVAGWTAGNWAKREAGLARRREAVTGVSEFPHLAEQPVVRDPAPPLPGGGLPRVRRAAGFEALRSRSDSILAAAGARPRIALVTLGSAAVHTPRSAFAANLFQAGGIETVLSEAAGGSKTERPDFGALAAGFTATGAAAACLCSSDALYGQYAEEAAAALKAAGARYVLLAGRPGDRREAQAAAGVDEFAYTGCNALAILTTVFDEIGAPA
jgi:methylmalonyl-CoA mutase